MAATTTDHLDLQRFVTAQHEVYAGVAAELQQGLKKTHWMWFVFPQMQGLGRSAMAQRYAISSLQEAQAYLAHPVLGTRLRECVKLVNAVQGRSIGEILGHPDYLKFQSSMTLFARATRDNQQFMLALKKYFDGQEDAQTLELIA
jgi:uncharacterized protein (DUF1810 family)